MTNGDIIAEIQHRRAGLGVTIKTLGAVIGVTESAMSDKLRRRRPITLTEANALLAAVKRTLQTGPLRQCKSVKVRE